MEPPTATEPTEVLAPVTETTTHTAPVESHQLLISITQTTDEESDLAHLHQLIDTLRNFSGQDEVILRVTNDERVVNLKLPPNTTTNYCPELHQRLVELVGEEGLRLEKKIQNASKYWKIILPIYSILEKT